MKRGNKKVRFILRVATSVILGFLPSFLFVILFVQYGSPFSNYIKFLTNFSYSFWAWISAFIIMSLVFFGGKILRSRKHLKTLLKNKVLFISLILGLVVVIVLVSVQLYLYVNFTLRNDILTELSVDKEDIFFTNQTQEDITFKISVTMNPFCTAKCDYTLFDLSKGDYIEEGSFNLGSILPKTKTYTLNNDHLVQGSQELNRFEISCMSKKTFLCYTKEEESKRSLLITINYNLTEDDVLFKNASRYQIDSIWQEIYLSKGRLNESLANINIINDSFSTQVFFQQARNLSNSFLDLNQSSINLKKLWETQKFSDLREELPELLDRTVDFSSRTEELKSAIIFDSDLYNNLTVNINENRKVLQKLSNMNMTSDLCSGLNDLIINFNSAFNKFDEESNLSQKQIIVENISDEVNNFYISVISSPGDLACSLNQEINNGALITIQTITQEPQIPELSFEELSPECCYDGECGNCCEDKCSETNYPIIFLHGYSLNKVIPLGYGLGTFTEVKDKLSSEGYIDAGGIVISLINEPKGLWGELNNTAIDVTASYFFDTYKTSTGEKTTPSSVDSIDTYAIRLRSIIDLLQYKTNKDKVILVAHSMGGLVVRRYIQVFGGDDVDKAILVAIPNHGIEGKVRDYCSLFGPEVACSEMDKNSLFINKLNNAPTEIVPTYNIIGIGCDMGNDTGDGILKNSTQYLDYATNYYLKGTCNELTFDFFHESIILPDKTPEIYDLIKKILKEN